MIIIFEIVFKWEVLRSATQACLEQEIPLRSKFRCTYERKVWHVRHRKLGEPGRHQVSWSIALHYIAMRQLTLAGTAANTATCSYLPWWRARAAPLPWAWFFATFWSFLSENHHAAAYNTSWTLLSSQSRPSSWSSCPSPGPHWSVACSLKSHSSETQYTIKWQDI